MVDMPSGIWCTATDHIKKVRKEKSNINYAHTDILQTNEIFWSSRREANCRQHAIEGHYKKIKLIDKLLVCGTLAAHSGRSRAALAQLLLLPVVIHSNVQYSVIGPYRQTLGLQLVGPIIYLSSSEFHPYCSSCSRRSYTGVDRDQVRKVLELPDL